MSDTSKLVPFFVWDTTNNARLQGWYVRDVLGRSHGPHPTSAAAAGAARACLRAETDLFDMHSDNKPRS